MCIVQMFFIYFELKDLLAKFPTMIQLGIRLTLVLQTMNLFRLLQLLFISFDSGVPACASKHASGTGDSKCRLSLLALALP